MTRLQRNGLAGAAAALIALAAPAFADGQGLTGRSLGGQSLGGQGFGGRARLGIEQARRIALAVHPGRIADEELEHEAGGSGLRYSFDIRRDRVTQEVGIDAVTGRVLTDAPEGSNPD